MPVAFYLIAVATLVADQVTKVIVAGRLALGQRIPVIPHLLYLTHNENPGAAFGILPTATVGLIVAGVVIIVVLVLYGRKMAGCRPLWIGLALQIGGAAGNLIDRIFHGEKLFRGRVVDFIDVQITPAYTWPTFNIADIAITVGAVLIAYCILTGRDGILGGADEASDQEDEQPQVD
ncbi:MAG TPA: signal peptidase II [Armatimonadota bacterium]|nr:signal peptidase II [Armatimonadota bacterium]